LHITQLAEKRRKEIAVAELRVAWEVAQKLTEQEKAAAVATSQETVTKEGEGQAMPSHG